MDAICYVCNEKTSDWRRNFSEIKSQHTQTPIFRFIRKFLGDFKSLRKIDSESNCICEECLRKIDDYDWTCQHAREQEVKLRELLWTTEAKLIDGSDALNGSNVDTTYNQNEMDVDHDIFSSIECGNDDQGTKTKDLKPQQIELNIRPMARSTTTKPIGPLSLKDVPIGTILKTKDGKIFRLRAKNMKSTTTATPAKDVSTPSTVKPLRTLVKRLPTSAATATAPNQVSITINNHLTTHTATTNASQINQEPQCTCDVCGNTFLNEEYLLQHKREHGTLLATAETLAIAKLIGTPNFVVSKIDHFNAIDNTITKIGPPKRSWTDWNYRRKCDVCGEAFRTKKLYFRHYRIHGKSCDICDKRYSSLRGIREHMKWHELHPGFVCNHCHFQSDDKPSYKEHMELHESKSSPFACVFCHKVYENAPYLRQHCKRTHVTPQSQVLCDLCGREFFSMEKLNVHKKVHSDEMPFECTLCPKRFKWKRNLENHVETHSTQRDRPFACAFCDMRFLRVDHCRVHERRHKENTKTESCPFCSATYEHKFHLKQHIKRKHNAEMPIGFSNVEADQNSV